jgi:hypothetical protein
MDAESSFLEVSGGDIGRGSIPSSGHHSKEGGRLVHMWFGSYQPSTDALRKT